MEEEASYNAQASSSRLPENVEVKSGGEAGGSGQAISKNAMKKAARQVCRSHLMLGQMLPIYLRTDTYLTLVSSQM